MQKQSVSNPRLPSIPFSGTHCQPCLRVKRYSLSNKIDQSPGYHPGFQGVRPTRLLLVPWIRGCDRDRHAAGRGRALIRLRLTARRYRAICTLFSLFLLRLCNRKKKYRDRQSGPMETIRIFSRQPVYRSHPSILYPSFWVPLDFLKFQFRLFETVVLDRGGSVWGAVLRAESRRFMASNVFRFRKFAILCGLGVLWFVLQLFCSREKELKYAKFSFV